MRKIILFIVSVFISSIALSSPMDSIIYYSHIDTVKMEKLLKLNFQFDNAYEFDQISEYLKLNYLIDHLQEEEALTRLSFLDNNHFFTPIFYKNQMSLLRIHCLINKEQYQDAFSLINKALSISSTMQSQNVKLIQETGRIYSLFGDYTKAKFYYKQSISLDRRCAKKYIADAYIQLASIALDETKLKLASDYLLLANKYLPISNNPLNNIRLLHYQGILYLKQNDFVKAHQTFQSLVNYALKINHFYYYGLASIDLADIYLSQNNFNKSVDVLKNALIVVNTEPNCKPDIYKKLGEVYQKIDVRTSLKYYELAYQWAIKNENKNILNFLLLEMYSQYLVKGDSLKAITLLKDKIEYDSLKYSNLSQKSINELNLKIVSLTESLNLSEKENLLLDSDKKIAEEKFKMSIIIFVLFCLFLIGVVIITNYYRNKASKQKKFHTAQLLKITENLKEEISKELHDNIGNELVLLINSLAKNNFSESDKIKQILEQLRDISKNLYPNYLRIWGFVSSVRNLCNIINSKSGINVFFVCDEDDFDISDDLKINLYRILQECFTNTIKHSNANFIKLEIFSKNNNLNIIFTDNGEKFDLKKNEKGMGLSFLEQRISFFSGSYKYFNSQTNGFGLEIIIPLK